MILVFDDLRQDAVGRKPRKTQPMLFEPILVGRVDFVAVTMAFGDFGRATINARDAAAAPKCGGVNAKPLRTAEAPLWRSPLQLVASQPLRHEADDRLGRRPEFGGIRIRYADQIADGL